MRIAQNAEGLADSRVFNTVAARPKVRRGIVFATIALALLMMSIDSTIVATILHSLQSGLGTTVNWAGWTLTAYSLGFMIMLPISGRLGDLYGRRRVFLVSVLVFTLSSLLCGLARGITELIILRAIQAAGGAGFTPSATGIIVDSFGRDRDRAVGLFGSIFPIGAMIGPIFGGFFVTWLNWRWAFFINVPIGIAIIALALRFIPADAKRREAGTARLDFLGMFQLGVAIFLIMLAISNLAEPATHPASPQVMFPFIAGASFLLFFTLHIWRIPEPFIKPKLILGRGFGAVNLVNMIFGGAVLGSISLVPFYASQRYHIDPLRAGTLLIAQGSAAILFSLLATWLLRRSGHRLPILIGGIFCAIGVSLLAIAPRWGFSPWAWLALATFIIGCGIGGANPASRNAGLELAPEHSGTQAALRSLFMQVGSIVIISVSTALLAAAEKPESAQATVFLGFGLLLLPALMLVRLVPEHRGAW